MANKRSPNAFLTYYIYNNGNGIPHGIDLWVDTLTQANTLSGTSAQSRLTRHFYPHAHSPGNIQIEGTCVSQAELATLAKFVRNHHIALMNQPSTEDFSRLPGHTGFRRLMTLSIPSENIWIRGFIPRFTITRRGVFEPAPKFQLEFFVVFDQHATDIRLSTDIRKYWQGGFDTVTNTADTAPSALIPPPGGFAAHKPLP